MSAIDTSGNYTVYRKQIYIKSGDFMAIITSSSDSEEKAQKALDLFTTANDGAETTEETSPVKESESETSSVKESESTEISTQNTSAAESIKNE